MRKKQTLIVIASVVLVAGATLAPPAFAQQAPAYLSVYTEHVKLGHDAEYADVVKELWAAMKKEGGDFAVLASQSLSNPGHYTFVTTLSSMADMDHQNEAFGKVFSAHGDLMSKFGKLSNGNESFIIAPRPDLSYQPDNPRVSDAEAGFARVMFVYPHPEHALDLETALRDAGELWKKKGINDGFGVFTNVTGAGPVYALRTIAKDEADFYTQQAKNNATLGQEGAALRNRVGPMIREIEYSASVPRPDLGYQP